MAFNIDYDRGVHKRTHNSTGINVYMYVDDPGVYLNEHGAVIDERFAREAGFPVDEQIKQRDLKKRLKAAHDAIMKEMQMAAEEKVVVEEKNGFQILDIGLGRHNILSPDGDVLTDHPLPLEEAKKVLNMIAPDEQKDDATAE